VRVPENFRGELRPGYSLCREASENSFHQLAEPQRVVWVTARQAFEQAKSGTFVQARD